MSWPGTPFGFFPMRRWTGWAGRSTWYCSSGSASSWTAPPPWGQASGSGASRVSWIAPGCGGGRWPCGPCGPCGPCLRPGFFDRGLGGPLAKGRPGVWRRVAVHRGSVRGRRCAASTRRSGDRVRCSRGTAGRVRPWGQHSQMAGEQLHRGFPIPPSQARRAVTRYKPPTYTRPQLAPRLCVCRIGQRLRAILEYLRTLPPDGVVLCRC